MPNKCEPVPLFISGYPVHGEIRIPSLLPGPGGFSPVSPVLRGATPRSPAPPGCQTASRGQDFVAGRGLRRLSPPARPARPLVSQPGSGPSWPLPSSQPGFGGGSAARGQLKSSPGDILICFDVLLSDLDPRPALPPCHLVCGRFSAIVSPIQRTFTKIR